MLRGSLRRAGPGLLVAMFLSVGSVSLCGCKRFPETSESSASSASPSAPVPSTSGDAVERLPPLNIEQLLSEATDDEQGLKRIGEAFLRPGVDVVSLTRGLQPRLGDYAKVFVESFGNKAQAGYSSFWRKGSPIRPWPEHKLVNVFRATVDDFKNGTAASEPFPEGYRSIANLFEPSIKAYVLRFESPKGARAVSYDGFVYVEDHWAYFPKPFRVIRAGNSGTVGANP